MRAYLWLEGNYYYYLHRDEITAKAMEQVNCRVDGGGGFFQTALESFSETGST